MKKFLEEILKIKKFDKKEYDSGRNHKTLKIKTKNDIFVLQKFINSNFVNYELIEEVIDFLEAKKIPVAGKFFDKRFFEFDQEVFQIMKKLPGKSVEKFDEKIISEMAKLLGKFHKNLEDFPKEKFEKLKTNKDLNYLFEEAKYEGSEKQLQNLENIYKKYFVDFSDLEIGIIHGDPAFKNFLEKDQKISGIIDYEKMEINYILWDLVDLIRSFQKFDNFSGEIIKNIIKYYEKERKLSESEKKYFKNFCILITLNTSLQYLIGANLKNAYIYANSNLEKNKIGFERCLKEIEKLENINFEEIFVKTI